MGLYSVVIAREGNNSYNVSDAAEPAWWESGDPPYFSAGGSALLSAADGPSYFGQPTTRLTIPFSFDYTAEAPPSGWTPGNSPYDGPGSAPGAALAGGTTAQTMTVPPITDGFISTDGAGNWFLNSPSATFTALAVSPGAVVVTGPSIPNPRLTASGSQAGLFVSSAGLTDTKALLRVACGLTSELPSAPSSGTYRLSPAALFSMGLGPIGSGPVQFVLPATASLTYTPGSNELAGTQTCKFTVPQLPSTPMTLSFAT